MILLSVYFGKLEPICSPEILFLCWNDQTISKKLSWHKLRCRSQMDIVQLPFSSEICQVQKNKTILKV